jgi:hypothetical protein
MVVPRGAGGNGAAARLAPVFLTAGQDGRFATDRLGSGEHLIVARADGHPTGHVLLPAEPSPQAAVEVTLPRPATVAGAVRQGAEPAAAWLIAQPAWLEAAPVVQNFFVARAAAGDDGVYAFGLLAPGRTRLMCMVAGAPALEHQVDLHSDQVARWDPIAGVPAEVTGTVVDATGAPLGGWHVWGRSDGGSTRTETLEDGTFRIGVPTGAGPVTVWARPREVGGDGWTDELQVGAKARDVRLIARMTPDDAGRLVGRVVDADGTPVRWAELTAMTVRPGVHGQGLLQRVSRFSVPMMPGRYAVSVRYADGLGVDLGEHAVAAGAVVDLGEIRPPELGRFVIRLRGSDGRLHEPTALSVAGHGGHASDLEVLDDGGRRTPPLGAGRFTIWARGETFAASFQNFELAPGPETIVEMPVQAATPVRFVVPRPDGFGEDWSVAATWQVRDAAGRPVPVGSPLPLSGGEEAVRTFGFVPGRYEYELSIDDQRAAGSFEVPSPIRAEPVLVRLRFGD